MGSRLANRFDGNDAERGAYLGLPVLAIVVLYAVARRRRPGARFLLAALGLSIVAALGTSLRVGGVRIVPLPWKLVAHVPPFTNVLPVRLALFTSLAAAVIVALWLASASRRTAVVAGVLVVLSLVPRLDLPAWSTMPDRPAFFAQGLYRTCLRPGETVFAVPYEGNGSSMLWQADADFAFRLAGGYVRPAPPRSYLRYRAVRTVHFTGDPPAAADLAALARDKGITRFVVGEAVADDWRPALEQFGAPTRIGGVFVYPGCGS